MLKELQLHEESSIVTTTTFFSSSVYTTKETASETNTEISTGEDTTGSYTINAISDKEAHIEIFDEIINNEYSIERDPVHGESAICMARFIEIDNITIGVWVWEFNTPWTWNNAYSQIFVKNDNGGGTDLSYIYTGDAPYYSICNVDTSQNKLSIDVVLPEDFDFNFNNYKSIEMKTE